MALRGSSRARYSTRRPIVGPRRKKWFRATTVRTVVASNTLSLITILTSAQLSSMTSPKISRMNINGVALLDVIGQNAANGAFGLYWFDDTAATVKTLNPDLDPESRYLYWDSYILDERSLIDPRGGLASQRFRVSRRFRSPPLGQNQGLGWALMNNAASGQMVYQFDFRMLFTE